MYYQVYLVQQARRANKLYYSDVKQENQRVVSFLLFLSTSGIIRRSERKVIVGTAMDVLVI